VSPRPDLPPEALEVILVNAVGAAFGEGLPLDSPSMLPANRLARLDAVDSTLSIARARVADARAAVIAEAVASSTTRQVAADLGLSPAAVAKAVARARDVARRVSTSTTVG
jgi:DNA-directed RNA polymerase specialized sigma24 family protein